MKPLVDIFTNFLSLGAKVKKSKHPYYHSLKNNPVQKMDFRVDCPETAAKLYSWYQRCDAAHQQVAQYVYAQLNAFESGGEFEYDTDGYLWRSAFVGTMPKGWRGGGGTQGKWIYADSDEAKQAIRNLPKLPSRRELHDLIAWPTIGENFVHKDFHDMVRLANTQVAPHGDTNTGQTYVCVPLPENFHRCPQIEDAYANWFNNGIPEFLMDVNGMNTRRDLDI